MDEQIIIRGGAGPYEAAAIAAVIEQLLAEEAAQRSLPPQRPRPEAWVLSGRPRTVLGPRSTFLGLSPSGDADEDHAFEP